MRATKTTLAVLLVALAIAGPLVRAASTNREREEGFALYNAGRYAEAVPLLDTVLERHPNDVEALVRRGNSYLRMDRATRAMTDFDRIVRRDPLNPSGHADRGIALLMLSRYDEAEAAFGQAIQRWEIPLNGGRCLASRGYVLIEEARAVAHAGLAQVYHRTGRDQEARIEYDRAIELYSKDPNAYIGRGDVHRALGAYTEALADLDEAVRLGPSYSRAFASRGRLLEDMKEEGRALADYDQAIAIDPRFAFAYSLRGGLRSRLGENEAALVDFQTVAGLIPEDAETHKDLGGVLVRMGRYKDALVELDRSLAIDPRQSKAYQNRGAAYNSLGRYDEAVADLDRAIELDPGNAGARSNAGLANFMIGRYDRAVEDLSEAVRLAPKNAVVHFNRGNVFAKLGLRDQALADYESAGRLSPSLVARYGGSAALFEEMSRNAMALRNQTPIRDASADVDEFVTRGRARQAEGDWPGAIAEYDRAVAADPRRADVYIARGWSRLCGDVDGAEIDAHAYLNLKGWSAPASPYMALLGALGARRAGREPEAYKFLENGLSRLPRQNDWPKPALLYLNGDLSDRDFLARAGNDVQKAEVHAILALDLIRKNRPDDARVHLEWVDRNAVDRSIAADLARATLARLPRSDQVARKP